MWHRTLAVIHRDIKPGNLMVDRSGRLKVLDFGVARMMGTMSSNGTALIGTPGYMAPEQILGAAMTIALISSRSASLPTNCCPTCRPFQARRMPAVTHRILSDEPQPLAQVCPEVGPAAAAVVQRALKKSAIERFGDAESMAAAWSDVRREFEASTTSAPTIAPGFVGVEIANGGEAQTPGPSGSKPTPVSTGQRSRKNWRSGGPSKSRQPC